MRTSKLNHKNIHEERDQAQWPGRNDHGVALFLALMILILLTFLGLTMAATTSTELQIATNYRLAQQAYYNAEAGMAVGRYVLNQIPDWGDILPNIVRDAWDEETTCGVDVDCPRPAGVGRDYEGAQCDRRGNGVGFGLVLVDPSAPADRYENLTIMPHLAANTMINGAVTIWVRRALVANGAAGTFDDDDDDDKLVMTVEGIAPRPDPGSILWAQTRAVRYIESTMTQLMAEGQLPVCGEGAPQHNDMGVQICRPKTTIAPPPPGP